MGTIGVDMIGETRRAHFEQDHSIKEIVCTLLVSRATESGPPCFTTIRGNGSGSTVCRAIARSSIVLGIYAVSDDKLHELDLLPGRAPDARVAISSLVTTNSRTTLPDGHITFIVYRRGFSDQRGRPGRGSAHCQD